MHGITRYEPKMEKIMRLHSVTSTIENGFVHLPDEADWLDEYRHELATFPYGREELSGGLHEPTQLAASF